MRMNRVPVETNKRSIGCFFDLFCAMTTRLKNDKDQDIMPEDCSNLKEEGEKCGYSGYGQTHR